MGTVRFRSALCSDAIEVYGLGFLLATPAFAEFSSVRRRIASHGHQFCFCSPCIFPPPHSRPAAPRSLQSEKAMLSAAVFVGNGLGSILLGSLSDRLGRKERHS